MNRNSLLLCVLGMLTYFVTDTVASEAIIGGQLATNIKPFRYVVSLLEVNRGHICGGALVGKQTVLTAAHCVIRRDNTLKYEHLYALMGTVDLMNMKSPSVNLKIVKIFVPTEYNATDINTTGDLAVLKLKEALRIGNFDNLKIIKLGKNKLEDHSGQKATIAGWGWNHFEMKDKKPTGRRSDSVLRYATADVYSHEQCQQEHPNLKIKEKHLCAKVEQFDGQTSGVCYNDDGGPLVHDGTLLGILSKFPNNCTEKTWSAVYSRVTHYLTFIRNAKDDLVPESTMRQYVLHP